MKLNNTINFVTVIILTIISMGLSKANAQFIFNIKDLNTVSESTTKENFSELNDYFQKYGYDRIEGTNDFQDKYLNKISFYVSDNSLSLHYQLKNPSANVISAFKQELKSCFSFINPSKKTSYIIDERCIIDFQNVVGKECTLSFMVMSDGNAYIPARKIDSSHLEVTSYRTGSIIKVKQGDKVYLKASGSIVFGAWAGSGGPEGIDGFESYSRRSGFKHGSLLCYIIYDKAYDGKTYGETFKVGNYSSFTAEKNGVLQFIVNDKDPSNNSGSFIVEYSINKELPN